MCRERSTMFTSWNRGQEYQERIASSPVLFADAWKCLCPLVTNEYILGPQAAQVEKKPMPFDLKCVWVNG